MTPPPRTVVVVGGGQAGASVLLTLRREGFDGRLVLLAAEPHLPYERPPLSKAYLVGEHPADRLAAARPGWYGDNDVQVHQGTRAVGLDTASRRVATSTGMTVEYTDLVVATGARPRLVTSEPRPHVRVLRTVEDADALRGELGPGRHLVIVGAGFIGAEVAAAARRLGADVTMLEALDVPMVRAVGPLVGGLLAGLHRDHGVVIRTREAVTQVEAGRGGGVTVHTDAGTIECDAVLAGIGVVPNVEVVQGTPCTVDDGVVVDAGMSTGIPGVYAVGDVANAFHPVLERHVRTEHFDAAIRQGTVAALNILGRDCVHADPYWFWSDQYDCSIQVVGDTAGGDLVLRGRIEERDVIVFHLRGGRVAGAVAVNRAKDFAVARRLVQRQARPDPGALADPSVELRSLVPART